MLESIQKASGEQNLARNIHSVGCPKRRKYPETNKHGAINQLTQFARARVRRQILICMWSFNNV